ncbi:hypothetical protein ACH5RR_034837 [Cinchona calisaya]|uniref:Uncharacterized protein n=1 Tax=Cinchona calisaya TaxID=153742 RepID=A0ABD2YC39_9GENT
MGVSSKGFSQQLCFISWQLLLQLIIVFLLNLQSANCVSSIENIPSGYGVGWGNNWTTGATNNEAEYVTDNSDEELFISGIPVSEICKHRFLLYNKDIIGAGKKSANCVSSIENIPSGYEVGWGNNWTTVATSNEAEYVTDSDEELFLMESHHQHEYYNNILDSQTDTINAENALSPKPICQAIRYQDCIEPNCGFGNRRCRAAG